MGVEDEDHVTTLNMLLSATNSICLVQYQLQTARVVSPNTKVTS
jgi:hypothetical protein